MNMDEIYVDQAVFQQWPIRCSYTPFGIKQIDSRFCHRIQAFKRGESYTEYSYNYSECRNGKPPFKEVERMWTDTLESLTKDITENPHLHPTIKENLLLNLRA